VQQIKHR
jgi:hypothetical protein